MLETLEVWARESGVEKILLRVFDTNVRARGLYEKMGYASEGVERHAVKFPDEYIDAIRMAKFVGAAPAASSSPTARKRASEADR